MLKRMKMAKLKSEARKKYKEKSAHVAKLKTEPSGEELDRIYERFEGNKFLEEVIEECSDLYSVYEVKVRSNSIVVYDPPESYPASRFYDQTRKVYFFKRSGYNDIDLDTAREMLYYIASKAFTKGFKYGYSFSPYSEISAIDIIDGFYAINDACVPLEERRKNF